MTFNLIDALEQHSWTEVVLNSEINKKIILSLKKETYREELILTERREREKRGLAWLWNKRACVEW